MSLDLAALHGCTKLLEKVGLKWVIKRHFCDSAPLSKENILIVFSVILAGQIKILV